MATKRRRANKTKRRGTRRRGGMGRFHIGRKFASLTGKNYVSKTILTKKRIQKIFDAVDEQYEQSYYNEGNSSGKGIINDFPSLTYEELKKSSTYKGIRKDILYKVITYIQNKIAIMKESDTVLMSDFVNELINNVNDDRSHLSTKEPNRNKEYEKAFQEEEDRKAQNALNAQS